MTLVEAKKVLLLELAHDKADIPIKLKLEQKTSNGYCFIVSWTKWGDSRQCFSFEGKKCFATYKYLLSRGFKL